VLDFRSVSTSRPLRVGRYTLHDVIGSGGMASVHLGRLGGPAGFARVVAIKRLHEYLARDREGAARFLDEARLATRIHHANVVQTLDVLVESGECLVVMEYVRGETLGRLLQVACKSEDPPPARLVSAIVGGVLRGLHAAHEAKSEGGEPLDIVHRDVSPQNILVGCDGIARLLDFGIAKAAGQSSVTPGGQVRGKTSYMAPEQVLGQPITARTDVFAASVVLWEALAGRRLFLGENEADTMRNVLAMPVAAPSIFAADLPPEADSVLLRGLARAPEARFASARDMALALEHAIPPASAAEVGAWVETLAHAALAARAKLVDEVDRTGREEGGKETAPPSLAVVADTPPPLEPLPRMPSLTAISPPPVFVEFEAPPRRRVRVFVAAAGGVAAVGLATALLVARHGAETAPPPALSAATAATADPPPPDAPPASAVAVAPTLSTPLPDGARTDRAARGRLPVAKSPPASAACTPPYTFNAAGHKVFKPQCL
jgi:hypothetical protein